MEATVKSGPDGADFRFYFEPDGWGLDGIAGNPFYVNQASLEGPGTLKLEEAIIADPTPTACFRGWFQGVQQYYRLKLEADSATTLKVPVRLTSSRLAGMKNGVSLVIPQLEGNLEYRTEISIEGPEGILVSFRAQGQSSGDAALATGKPFRLVGSISPALAGVKVKLVAEPRMYQWEAPRPTSRRLATVTTDGNGRFRSGPLKLNAEATWVLHAIPTAGPAFDDEPSCGPVIETKARSRSAYTSDLDGSTFRSVSVKGTKLVGQRRVKLRFEVKAENARWAHYLTGSAGCNRIRGEYRLKQGRLVWTKRLAGTKIGCAKPVDRWLTSNLRRGMNARMVDGQLVLKNKRGLKIILRRVK